MGHTICVGGSAVSLLFGYHMHSFTFPGVPPERLFDHVVDLATAAEDAGFGLITVMDHVYQLGGPEREPEPMLEAYTTLGAIAARTQRARIGTLVTGVTYRNPALLAKEATTLDVISHGRAVFGLGAAWNESEHIGYGFAFPPIKERMDRLDEALTIAKLMFTEERPSFAGRYYSIDRALNSPRPLQEGGPPILIGGMGEQRTLRLVAKHGDLCHWFPTSVEHLTHLSEVLERYCEEGGRDPSTITKTVGAPFLLAPSEAEADAVLARVPPERRPALGALTPARAAEAIQPFVDLGFRGFTFGLSSLPDKESIGLAGELIGLLSGSEALAAVS